MMNKMDSFKFDHKLKVEKKANAKITTLFRFLELIVFIIIISRFSTQFSFSFNRLGEYFKGISITLISPGFVFLVGNLIVVVLFVISGQFPGQKFEKSVDFYDEYVEKCQNNNSQREFSEEVNKVCENGVVGHHYEVKKKKMVMMSRCKSENLGRVVEARGKDLRRSVSESCRKREDEMSGEEFRRTVEAFIARQQRFLREEEDEGFSAVVTV
ncbi:hypothetical protein CASFOL_036172 [Castilleja foliolosa]|uniref:Uncharacterized protein n=1 Tax=Castilleja foliolosa TaxID=1961234 RepID=A0ABD3BUW0_9LAMI